MKPEEKIERAYEELRAIIDGGSESFTHEDAVQYLKEKLKPAIYEPEQEPVAWLWELTGEVTTDPDRADGMWLPLYTTPPQRTWVGLDDTDLAVCDTDGVMLAKYWERVCKEKNT